MDLVGVLRAVFALMTVLGLILGLAFILRRYAPQLMARLTAPRGQKRMQVVETLVLDPARRLVLVRLDDEERLLLLGEGKELIEPRQMPKPKPKLPPEPAPTTKPTLRTRPLSDKDL